MICILLFWLCFVYIFMVCYVMKIVISYVNVNVINYEYEYEYYFKYAEFMIHYENHCMDFILMFMFMTFILLY